MVNLCLNGGIPWLFKTEGSLCFMCKENTETVYHHFIEQYILLGFEFRESVFFWVLVTAAVFFGLLNKSCILKCFIFSTEFFWVQCYSPSASIIMDLHYYHIVLDFCEMNNVSEGIFGFCFSESSFWRFSVSGKVFFGSFRNTQLR